MLSQIPMQAGPMNAATPQSFRGVNRLLNNRPASVQLSQLGTVHLSSDDDLLTQAAAFRLVALAGHKGHAR